jgi:hypothetical protein
MDEVKDISDNLRTDRAAIAVEPTARIIWRRIRPVPHDIRGEARLVERIPPLSR